MEPTIALSVETEAFTRRSSVKRVLLEISQNSQENTCARVSFLIKMQASTCNFIKKETLAQVFSCEYSEISKNNFSYRTPPVAASVESKSDVIFLNQTNCSVQYYISYFFYFS